MWNPFRSKKDRGENPEFTPDLALLENRQEHLLFHYGDQFGHLPQVGIGFTDEKMIMWVSRTQMGAAPVALQLHVQRNIPRGRIGGFLYVASTEELISLDTGFENGVVFNRKRVKLRLPHDSQTRNREFRHYTEQRAFMYVGNKDYWEPKIDWDSCFHRGNGTSEFYPADHQIAGAANLSVDGWVRRYYEFHRRPVETIITKTFIYFKGSRRYQPVEEPQAPVPGDDMRRRYSQGYE